MLQLPCLSSLTAVTSDQGSVARIQLTRAVLDAQMLRDLLAVLTAVREASSVRVLVISGESDDFSLGGDRQELDRLITQDPRGAEIRRLGESARLVFSGLAELDAVTIARVQGRAVGAGLALAVACDLRVGAHDSLYRLPEVALGLPGTWGGAAARLISEIGPAATRELLLTGRSVDAETALRMAILHRVTLATELDDAVSQWIRPLLRRPAAAVRTTKRVLAAYEASARMADLTRLEGHLMAAEIGWNQR
ncbi:crotonase [Kitasatospora herbaricolor]|uniref:enoyl-CoA hydratase/isomerase family protein n=1 Tax=Kitasatospora herbaricolor TaxID=68217 RepID=UPI00174CD2E2|nr:enoyl-CoA hydratase/isomerase family protein [Kitasatospora herbaricolor]MDQ0305744.1 methylglutaconyl-CoA hydratase [Kitasatospora herbaricolor]GGV27049.1 crotonase [Kitasatospora herbaricolor]